MGEHNLIELLWLCRTGATWSDVNVCTVSVIMHRSRWLPVQGVSYICNHPSAHSLRSSLVAREKALMAEKM